MERGGYSRKKMSMDDPNKGKLRAAAIQEVLPGYEEYLILLQERNKLLKQMRKKNKKQIEQEKKEKGFSIYVNGANTNLSKSRPKSNYLKDVDDFYYSPPKSHRVKTAGEATNKRHLNQHDIQHAISYHNKEEQKRGKTAPARERRRNWLKESIEVKTARGESFHLKAPEMLTGNYAEDFESADFSDDSINEEEQKQMRVSTYIKREDSSDDEDDEDEEEEEERVPYKRRSFASKTQPQKSPKKTVKKKPHIDNDDNNSDSDDNSTKERLMLSIADVKKLRQSLCMNNSIKESLAQIGSSDEENNVNDEDEVEEDLVPATESSSFENQMKKPFLKPTDTVVLEFNAPSSNKSKGGKDLSLARKKDAEFDYQPQKNTATKKTPRAQSAVIQFESNTSSKRQNRPLSANRISKEKNVDTKEEASAVLAALKAENEKASKNVHSRKLPATPTGRQPKPFCASEAQLRKSEDKKPHVRDAKDSKTAVHSSKQSVDSSVEVRKSVSKDSKSKDQQQSFLKDNRLQQIMDKVLQMQPKQQKKLMKVLENLDESTSDTSLSENLPPPNQPVKATKPTKSMVKKSQEVSREKPLVPQLTDLSFVDINIEMLSNWGHANLIGLTEIQFFDQDNQLIQVTPDQVQLLGSHSLASPVDVLFNRKFKTNKDRNMWCCKFKTGKPVELSFNLPGKVNNKPLHINKIKIWNYNKSINDLSIGVKDCRVFLGGELVFNGQVEKGCGNQVFDYGMVVYQPDASAVSKANNSSNASPSPAPKKSVTAKNNVQNGKSSSPKQSVSPSNEESGGLLLKPTLSPRSRGQVVKKHTTGHSSDSFVKDSAEDFKKPPRPLRLHSQEDKSPESPSPSPSDNSANKLALGISKLNLSSDSDIHKVRSETRTMNYSDREKDKNLSRPAILSDRSGSSEFEDGEY